MADIRLSLLATVVAHEVLPTGWVFFLVLSSFTFQLPSLRLWIRAWKKAWFAQKKIAWSASVLSRLKTSVRRHKFSFSLLASCVADRVYYLTDDWEKWAPATIWPQTEDGFYICYLNYLERKGFGNEVLTFSPCWLRNQLQEYYQKWIYSYMYIYMCVYIIYA